MKHLVIPILAVVATVLNPTHTYADLGDQLFKLLPSDGEGGDHFGNSVAISGTTAIVGAWLDDNDNGGQSGSAYLFDTTTGKQLFKLLANDGASNDIFGRSVSISGNTAIVGTPSDGDNGVESGSAYLFDTITGRQLYKLLPNPGEEFDEFGISVAISGASVIAGAHFNFLGTAYLFDATKGTQITELLQDDHTSGDEFGFSVAINGTIAIIGARWHDDNGENSGSAYLFDTVTGKQLFELLPDDGDENDLFGYSVGISGTTAVVGAYGDDDNGSGSGSAYTFDTATGKQLYKLLANDGAAGDGFGQSVGICGSPGNETAIIGARNDDDNGFQSGSAYLFDTTKGQQIAKLLAEDGAEGEKFGDSVAIGGPLGQEIAIVGAWLDDDNGIFSGSAYLFDAAVDPIKCPWDLDSSGAVGTGDLLALFAQWGTAGSADFDGSGTVGTSDLLILFANWGPCK